MVTNQKSMVQCMESLSLKLQPGVVINFQKIRGNSPLNEEQEPMEVNGTSLRVFTCVQIGLSTERCGLFERFSRECACLWFSKGRERGGACVEFRRK